MTERYQTQKHLGWILGILIIVVVLGYIGFEIKNVVLGPQITVTSPRNDATVSTSTITITGVAKNIESISLDDSRIVIDEKGNFSEERLLSPGYNALRLDASDKFGAKTEKILEIIYQPVL